ncbi:FHA domain-containing protein [Leifsonia sp. A12D58]|uniref:FHA domain-containing protein n=1 Tax=Leifsonia sp. A12D58 TaxID=3397674 RepID=UPI0039E11ECD
MNCQICGAELPEGAMFCGECGSSTTATAATRKRQDPRPADTTIIHPLPRTPGVVSVPVAVASGTAKVPVETAEQVQDERAAAAAHFVPGAAKGAGATSDASASVTAYAPGAPAMARSDSEPQAEAPRAPQAPQPTVRFVLQFSTGETVVVHGTGLIGRRPLPQPAEHYDHLIQIADVGMSVSKTHLEFGQHDGEFWISDRFSGNGTAIRRPDEAAHRCEPGRRYLVPRGSRVEMADQFFMVI